MLDVDLIETPENVVLERPLAGIGSRFLAGFVDTMLLAGIYLVLVVLLVIVSGESFSVTDRFTRLGTWAVALLIFAFLVVYWGYFVFFEMLTNGQSPGKKYVHIRVVKQGGGALTFLDSAIRNLLRPVDGLVIYGVAGVCMFLTRRCQRLGDLAAGTVVVSEQMRDYAARTDRKNRVRWEQETSAAALRATGLQPEDHRLLSNYWARREQLTLEARKRILPELLRPVLARRGEPLEDESLEALERLVSELLHRTQTVEEDSGAQT